MKLSTISLLLLLSAIIVGCANSFTPVVTGPSSKTVTATAPLQYTMIPGIEPEEQDEESREIVLEMMKHRKGDHADDQYAGYDASISEQQAINTQINVDSFSNGIAGGIIPGIQLTSLCGDD